MSDLKEIRINSNELLLKDNVIRGTIFPEKVADLARNVTIRGNAVIEGAVCVHNFIVKDGPLSVEGAVFVQEELYVDTAVAQPLTFLKCVACADTITSRAPKAAITFGSDINAKVVTLNNAFVAGSIYADEITLNNCVVIGGVFAAQSLEADNCIMGTFNSPSVHIKGTIQLLLPTAFSVEPLKADPGAKMYNLSLCDLGHLFRDMEEEDMSGRIPMNLDVDRMSATLRDDERQMTLRSYTVVGKVIGADLINSDKFQNHFLLTAGALNTQLLRAYDLGPDSDGNIKPITLENLRRFFFDILDGKIVPKDMDSHFDLLSIVK